MVSGQRSEVSGQLSEVSGQRSVVSCQCEVMCARMWKGRGFMRCILIRHEF